MQTIITYLIENQPGRTSEYIYMHIHRLFGTYFSEYITYPNIGIYNNLYFKS